MSIVAGTEPSMEFSMATMAQSTSPFETASMVSELEGRGTKRRTRPSGARSSMVARSASSEKVPDGPRKPIVVAATGRGSVSDETAQRTRPLSGASQFTMLAGVVQEIVGPPSPSAP